jgi:hypothetical protein
MLGFQVKQTELMRAREVRQLRHANEILRKASAYFPQVPLVLRIGLCLFAPLVSV